MELWPIFPDQSQRGERGSSFKKCWLLKLLAAALANQDSNSAEAAGSCGKRRSYHEEDTSGQ